jgi:hypothetical protein
VVLKKYIFFASPDGSKYPFMPVFGIKDIVDSGRGSGFEKE